MIRRRKLAGFIIGGIFCAFVLGLVIGRLWSDTTLDRKWSKDVEPIAPTNKQDFVGTASPANKDLQPGIGDSPVFNESRLTEADSQTLGASSLGSRIFLPGTFVLDTGFLQSVGIPAAKADVVSMIYADSLEEILQMEAKGSTITPALDGHPPILKVKSDQGAAGEIVNKMQKALIEELGLVPGTLLGNSLSDSSLIRASLNSVEREIVIQNRGPAKLNGGNFPKQIWESYVNDSGTLVRSTIGYDYLEQRYGDAGTRLIEMTHEAKIEP